MSKKRFSLLNPSEHFESFQANAEQLIKWELCFICQEESSSPLTCPANSTSDRDGTRGYSTVIANLTNFKGIGKLPASLQVRIQRENLLQDLIQNKAKFHKSCIAMIVITMSERARGEKRRTCLRKAYSQLQVHVRDLLRKILHQLVFSVRNLRLK